MKLLARRSDLCAALGRRGLLSGAAAGLLASACGDEETSPTPEVSNAEIELPRAQNESTEPNVFELTLEAAVTQASFIGGVSTEVWGYNGTVPGPLIEAKVGDRLKVHFKNALPEGTTIHWHGLRLPAEMDGTLAMQNPVPPGGTFEYEFVLRDAGYFWFHPHVMGDLQVQRGLYGTIVVRGEEPGFDRELAVVLDDIRLLPSGAIDEYPDDEGLAIGREGKTLLFNGHVLPTVYAQPGETLRLRLVNTANGRFFNFRIAGHTLRVIGSDGGLVEQPFDTETLLLSPGERYDVLVSLRGDVGDRFAITNEPYERGHDTGLGPALPLATLELAGDPVSAGALPDGGPPQPLFSEMAPIESIVLDEGTVDGMLAFTINGAQHPDVTPITVPLGELRIFEVRNDSEMDHPFHVHGTFFQVIARDGVPTSVAERFLKDTVIVQQKSSLTLSMPFEEVGRWMFHCHILEHAELGMMGEIVVV